jgi:hypothetical protein
MKMGAKMTKAPTLAPKGKMPAFGKKMPMPVPAGAPPMKMAAKVKVKK